MSAFVWLVLLTFYFIQFVVVVAGVVVASVVAGMAVVVAWLYHVR